MDLGATICKSKNPSCDICPLGDSCSKFIIRQTSKQKKFAGSMRQKRGLVLKMLLSEKKMIWFFRGETMPKKMSLQIVRPPPPSAPHGALPEA